MYFMLVMADYIFLFLATTSNYFVVLAVYDYF